MATKKSAPKPQVKPVAAGDKKTALETAIARIEKRRKMVYNNLVNKYSV